MADMAFRCIQEMDIDNRMTVYMSYQFNRSIVQMKHELGH
jgi:hypothetical protein